MFFSYLQGKTWALGELGTPQRFSTPEFCQFVPVCHFGTLYSKRLTYKKSIAGKPAPNPS